VDVNQRKISKIKDRVWHELGARGFRSGSHRQFGSGLYGKAGVGRLTAMGQIAAFGVLAIYNRAFDVVAVARLPLALRRAVDQERGFDARASPPLYNTRVNLARFISGRDRKRFIVGWPTRPIRRWRWLLIVVGAGQSSGHPARRRQDLATGRTAGKADFEVYGSPERVRSDREGWRKRQDLWRLQPQLSEPNSCARPVGGLAVPSPLGLVTIGAGYGRQRSSWHVRFSQFESRLRARKAPDGAFAEARSSGVQ